MKCLAFFLMAACMHASATGFSQETEVSLNEKNLRLGKFFRILEKQTGYHFSYSSNFVPWESTVSVKADNEKLSLLLKRVLTPLGLGFQLADDRLIVIVSLSATAASPQADTLITVRGKITSRAGNPVQGATVTVKGTSRSAITDENGSFVLQKIAPAATLIVTSVSYETQEIKLSGQTTLNIQLQTRITALEDVVVTTGLYQRPIENFTGASRSFSDAQLRSVSNRNALDAVKTLDPAFRIPENLSLGSDPNHLPQIQMRGANSLPNAGIGTSPDVNLRGDYVDNPNLPLFILDGFEVTVKRIYDLDMNLVEKITLLKDAAATSIYGSRAANGVVIIDTKQPEKGKLQVNYNSNYTLTLPDLTSYRLLNAAQKLQLEQAAGIYTAEYMTSQEGLDLLYSRRLAEVSRGVNTYWLSQPLRTSFGHKHSFYINGGDNYVRYGIDLSYNNDNNGVMKGSGRTNYSAGINLSYRHKQLFIRNYVSIVSNKATRSPYGSFSQYAALNPYWRLHDSLGAIPKVLEESIGEFGGIVPIYNPMYDATLNTKNFTKYLNVTDNLMVQWNLNNDLRFMGRFSIYTQKERYENFLPADAIKFATGYTGDDFFRRGEYRIQDGEQLNYQGDATLNYARIRGKNAFYATAGFQFQQDTYQSSGMLGVGFPNQNLDNIGYAYSYEPDGRPSGNQTIRRTAGYLANASYTYDDRYLLDASIRLDGSSQFGANKRFGTFWSIGGGWNLHKERFVQDLLPFADRLKLRASYGSTGSQNFPSYLALQSYRYMAGRQYRLNTGAVLLGLGNADLQWQQNYKTNVGMDMELLKRRFSFSANYYIEKTNALISSITTPPSQGFNNYMANLGNVENRGIELYLTAFVIKNDRQRILWSVNTALFHNRNRILKISESLKQQNDEQRDKSASTTAPVLLLEEGKSQSAIYAVRSLGIDPSNGYEILIKKDGTLTYTWDANDQVAVGDAQAAVYGTFGTNLMYKGFSLNAVFRTTLGGDIYNQTLADRVENADLTKNVDIRVLEQRWQKPGDRSLYKGVTDLNGSPRTDVTRATSRFVQRNNALFCDAITLGYEFNDAFCKKLRMRYLRAFFYLNNLFVISSVKQERGLDYPFARTYSISLQTSF